MLAALETAKKAGTVTAIDELAKKYPNHQIDPEIKAARHALFTGALNAWATKGKPDATTRAFMEKLLAYTEAQGSACEVRFRMKPSKNMDDGDKSIKRSGHYPAPDALPSKYVTVDASRPREQRVAAALVEAFAADFPADILAMKAGDPLDPDAPVPATVPTLVVDYEIDWAHANNLAEHPLTIIAGLAFTFEPSFVLPQDKPLKVSVRSWRGPELWKVKGGDSMLREDYEQKVYDSMFDTAFDLLQKRLTDALL
jgi:hypothetical protein